LLEDSLGKLSLSAYIIELDPESKPRSSFATVLFGMKLEPLVWAKGTLLNPQYLQQQDRFLEGVLQFRLENLLFRPWGFRTLEISQTSLWPLDH
jgi:hypothetical protein